MIFAHQPMSFTLGDNTSSTVNVCFRQGNRLVSLCLDNSSGALDTLSRGDIELFRFETSGFENTDTGTPCTQELFPEWDGRSPVPATLSNFNRAMGWLGRTSWGFSSAPPLPMD